MDTKKITPWIDWQEWKSVVDDAYNVKDDPVMYRRALSAIIAWEARDQNLPSGILGLKELIIAKLARLNRTSESIDSSIAYQSTVAMNVVRFVNFITEPFQTNTHAKAIKQIAHQIGIPDWIVNLRHSATHFNLPSIEILEKAIDYLFEYLDERYVSTYEETTLEQSILENVKTFIKNEFTAYMNARYKLTLMRPTKKGKDNKSFELASAELDEKVENATANFKNETFEILLEDGYMIPTNEQLNALGIMTEEFLEQDNLNIPKSFLNIWTKFLNYCNENSLMGFFLSHLITAYKHETENMPMYNQESLRSKFLISWILYLLKFNSYKNEKLKNSKFQFNFSFKQVLLDVLSKPNSFTLLFLNEIRKIASFSSEISQDDFEKIQTLISLSNLSDGTEQQEQALDEESNGMETDENISFYDLSAFEKLANPKPMANSFMGAFQMKKKYFEKTTDWKLIEDSNWNYENLKLGFIENQSSLNFNLDIDQFSKDTLAINSLNSSLNQSYQEAPSSPDPIQNPKNLRDLKKQLMNNYWEFAS